MLRTLSTYLTKMLGSQVNFDLQSSAQVTPRSRDRFPSCIARQTLWESRVDVARRLGATPLVSWKAVYGPTSTIQLGKCGIQGKSARRVLLIAKMLSRSILFRSVGRGAKLAHRRGDVCKGPGAFSWVCSTGTYSQKSTPSQIPPAREQWRAGRRRPSGLCGAVMSSGPNYPQCRLARVCM